MIKVDPRYNKLYKLACDSGDGELIELTMTLFTHARALPGTTDIHDWAETMAGYIAYDDTEGMLRA